MVPRSSKLDIFYLKADDGHLAALGPVYCERFETLDRPKTLLETQVTAVSAALTGTLRCRSITGKPWVRTYVLDAPRLTSDPTSLPSTGVCPACPCAAGLASPLGKSPWRGPTHRKPVQLLPSLSFDSPLQFHHMAFFPHSSSGQPRTSTINHHPPAACHHRHHRLHHRRWQRHLPAVIINYFLRRRVRPRIANRSGCFPLPRSPTPDAPARGSNPAVAVIP